MPTANVLPALSKEDPLFGLIYYVLGGWLIGSSTVLLLEGILIVQVYNYYAWLENESIQLNIAVFFLFILTAIKTIQSFAITWINNILYMQDPAGTVALNKEWYQILNIPLGAVIAAYVQTYYCYRLWLLSNKGWHITPLVIVMILGLVSAIITASVIAKTGKSSNWFAVHVSCTFATDVLITGTSTLFLIRARQEVLSHTRKLIGSLIKISCQTALPVTTATMIELICAQIGGPALKPEVTNSIILVLLDVMPIIYANCMLYTLNTRRSLGENHHPTQSIDNSESPSTISRLQWRRGPGEPVELSLPGDMQLDSKVGRDHMI